MRRRSAFFLLTLVLSLTVQSAPAPRTLPAMTTARYQTTTMNPRFLGETQDNYPRRKPGKPVVHYMTLQERESHRVVIYRGVVLTPQGQPVSGPDHLFNFVMDAAGNFYFFDQEGHEEIRHSSVLGAAPVAGAGEIWVNKQGLITKINSQSGHYGGTVAIFDQTLQELTRNGVNLQKVQVDRGAHK